MPPDLEGDACASPSLEDPVAYVDMVRQRLALTHQQMTPPPAPVAINPYHEDDLIFVMTTPPERSSKLAPRWKGPFFIRRVPNAYQVTYKDGMVWRTVHINHVKPAKTPAGGFPIPMPTPEPPLPPPVYLPRSYQWKRPAKLPQPAAPAAKPPQPAAPAAEPAQPAATPPPSRPTTRSSANHKLAPRSEPRSPATPRRTPENSRSGQPNRAVKSRPQPAAPQLLKYEQCLGHREGPYSFCSLVLEDLHSGHKEYLGDIQQLVNALPRSLDPGSRLTLKAQVTPPGQKCLPRAMRASLWWLLPSDGEFQSTPNGNQYYLARQGRRVVLRGGDIKAPLRNSRVNWIYDPAPPPPRHAIVHSRNSRVSIPSHRRKNEVSAIPPVPLSSIPTRKRRSRRRRLDRRANERERERERKRERGREREKLGIVHLFLIRTGPISAQQFQQFQQERPSRFLKPATPHQPCGRQCTRLPGL